MNKSNIGEKPNYHNFTYEYIKALKILAPREVEVLKEVALGRTSREIGDLLHISGRTVEKHRENIRKKLGLSGYRSLFHWCQHHMNHSDNNH